MRVLLLLLLLRLFSVVEGFDCGAFVVDVVVDVDVDVGGSGGDNRGETGT